MKKELLYGLYGVIIGISLTAFGFVLAGQGGDRQESAQSSTDHNQQVTAELEGLTGEAFDTAFLEEMIVHHEGAIDMARLVSTRSENSDVRQLSTAIITSQEDEVTMMKRWLSAMGIDVLEQHNSGVHSEGM